MGFEEQQKMLTPRQIEILELISLGYTQAETASKLKISPAAIHMAMQSIYAKLEARNAPHCVRLAVEGGLIGQRQELDTPPVRQNVAASPG